MFLVEIYLTNNNEYIILVCPLPEYMEETITKLTALQLKYYSDRSCWQSWIRIK